MRLLSIIFWIILLNTSASAEYARHNRSIYSCNEINADRVTARTETDRKRFEKEYEEYCSQFKEKD